MSSAKNTANKKSALLSIVVPTYNCESSLKKGVLSLVDHSLVNLLEIIIINDGSSDSSLKIARELAKKYPSVKVINKENGGHGSTINVGLKQATGKYFRLMDADDYYDTKELVKFLKRLKEENTDMVLTDYTEVDFDSGSLKPVCHYSNLPEYKTQKLDNMVDNKHGFNEFGPLLSTTTCKTALLKSAKFKLDENCFYVDMEYNFMAYMSSETVIYYPLNVYRYVVGETGQSVSIMSKKRNYLDHERVCFRLLNEYELQKNKLSPEKQKYLRDKLVAPMCDWQYYILLHYLRSQKEFLKFDEKLKKYPDFYYSPKVAGKVVKLMRLLRGYGLEFVVLINELMNGRLAYNRK